MHRTDADGAVDGKFQPGNPAIGQRATLIDADWLNGMQEEIATVIETAGIVLDKTRSDQLYAAVIAIATGASGDGSGGVPTTRRVTGGGLATGGGDLAVDRVVTVAKATPAEVSAATRDDVAVTPVGLAGLVGVRGTGNTMILQLGSAVVQVFRATAQGNRSTVITLPETFPTQCVGALCNGGAQDDDAQDNFPYVSGVGTSSISVFNARGQALPITIVAFGR